MKRSLPILLSIMLPFVCSAQDDATLKQILERLAQLESQNRVLTDEVTTLKQQLASRSSASTVLVSETSSLPPKLEADPPAVPLEERLAVEEQRVDEHAQSKVEASQRFPIQLTGTVLFNTFLNSRYNGGSQNPLQASATPALRTSGATMRQTILGLRFQSPNSVVGAKVTGFVDFDFASGTATNTLNWQARLRVAEVKLDWKTRSLSFNLDKPLISPRDPTSLSQVSISPLTSAGNLWIWEPQVRFEQRFNIGDITEVKAQVAVYQTAETLTTVADKYLPSFAGSRPALQGRVQFAHVFANKGRIELAPGYHISSTHVAGLTAPSRLWSADWLISPIEKLEFTGEFYNGENVANMGALKQGFTIFDKPLSVLPVHSMGGWGQLSYAFTNRLRLNAFSGQENDRKSDLTASGRSKNLANGGNLMFHIAPNVVTSLEYLQTRTTYISSGTRLHNHIDLAVAYMF